MFPYRRGGGKKRPKSPFPGQNGREQQQQQGGGGRRMPGSPRELLPLMQPTTKALAQMLAGNSRSSGQLVHARGVLSQAERFVDDRQVDRLNPGDREEFLEQFARLKLTLADADALLVEQSEEDAAPAKPVTKVAPDRLRELALSLATTTDTEAIAAAQRGPNHMVRPGPVTKLYETEDEVIVVEREPEPAEPEEKVQTGPVAGPDSPRRERLRLKSTASS